MSSAPTVPIEQLRPALVNSDVAFLISCGATALVLYEYVITLQMEVHQVWKGNISGAAILFILTRYITLIDRILVSISLSGIHTTESCRIVTWLQVVTTSMLVVVMSAIASARVYALWSRSTRLFVLVMIAGVFPALTNVFLRGASVVFIVPTKLFSCQAAPIAMSALAYTALSMATRIVAIISDGLVVVFTWIKTYRVFVLTRKMQFRVSYSVLIFRDGTLYFMATCFVNLIAIIYIMNVGTNLLNDMIITLNSILMARFLLNLRDGPGHTDSSMDMNYSNPVSTIRFASSLVNSMGGTADVDDESEDRKDEDTSAHHFGHRFFRDVLPVAHSTKTELQEQEFKDTLVLGEIEAVWV